MGANLGAGLRAVEIGDQPVTKGLILVAVGGGGLIKIALPAPVGRDILGRCVGDISGVRDVCAAVFGRGGGVGQGGVRGARIAGIVERSVGGCIAGLRIVVRRNINKRIVVGRGIGFAGARRLDDEERDEDDDASNIKGVKHRHKILLAALKSASHFMTGESLYI